MQPLPAGDRRWSAQKKLALAFALILVPWLSVVDAQQVKDAAAPQHIIAAAPHHGAPRQQDRKDSSQPIPAHNDGYHWDATLVDGGRRETPILEQSAKPIPVRREGEKHEQQHTVPRSNRANSETRDAKPGKQRSRNNNPLNIPSTRQNGKSHDDIDDSGALAPVAPAESVRARSPRQNRPNIDTTKLASPLNARSLGDWEVEDFVLLATVDGDLYASDRKTGKERWHLEVDQPMIETTHFRTAKSTLDDDYDPMDHYIWAVEPSRDGEIYIWTPLQGAGIGRTGLTMKQIVEDLAPYSMPGTSVLYTGDKKTTMVTLDAATGRILKWFGSGGSHVNDVESCMRPSALYDIDSEECSSTGTITLGRIEYTVGIQRKDGEAIATLKYSEWGPNNFDNDLLQQYHMSLDSHYMTSKHDGKVYVFDIRSESPQPLSMQKFANPVARVFDVCHRWDARDEHNPELVALPQPPMPSHDEEDTRARNHRVFLNQTDNGSWYALSGRAYPLIVNAPPAMVSTPDWWELAPPWDSVNNDQVSLVLVGTHYLGQETSPRETAKTLPAGPGPRPFADLEEPSRETYLPEPVEEFEPPSIINRVRSLPQSAANSFIEFISNPTLIIVFVLTLAYNQKQLRQSYRRFKDRGSLKESYLAFSSKLLEDSPVISGSDQFVMADSPPGQSVHEMLRTDPDRKASVDSGVSGSSQDGQVPTADAPKEANAGLQAPEQSTTPNDQPQSDTNVDGSPPEVKKKTRRGRRAGVKHRPKSKGQTSSQQGEGEKSEETVTHAVDEAKNLVKDVTKSALEPDAKIFEPDHNGVLRPVLRLGNIDVQLDNQLGTGSNGTLVFAGEMGGRPVAVKRMLIQFYDIASQETKLLMESDDHPNVIRYYSSQQRDGFLYIALERCAASLADVVERPHAFKNLAEAGQQDVPAILFQITNGINHLHSLRIVHRDLKPQNILVNTGKDGKPRMLVSDFGLCKKLDTGQSSFGATTGHAAGTTGWRAPELLRDDDRPPDADSSLHSGSGTVLVGDAGMSGSRRATRSIDIFSLGLVFYYVLTNGRHPFDCGDRYMREVNIRNGNKKLDHLDSLGDFAHEAKSLITWMLDPNPAARPSAREIMAHPFFWSAKKRLEFLCDVSDHFEKEPRDPPSKALEELERHAPRVINGDFLKLMPRDFVDSLGKQRKYNGARLLDLLRALRNKKNHFEDMPETLRKTIGSVQEGYLSFWTVRFTGLLLACWEIVYNVHWDDTDRFRDYYNPAGL